MITFTASYHNLFTNASLVVLSVVTIRFTICGNKDKTIRLNRVARYKMPMTTVMHGDDTQLAYRNFPVCLKRALPLNKSAPL